MSAQVIAALRRRADEQDRLAVLAQGEDPPKLTAALVRLMLAQEFRDLADAAEGQKPQTSMEWE